MVQSVRYTDIMVQEWAMCEELANSTERTIAVVFVALVTSRSNIAVVTAAEYWLYCPRLVVKFEQSIVIPSPAYLA